MRGNIPRRQRVAWNEMSFVAAEVRRPKRNLLWALVWGTVAVTGIYLLIHVAFLKALGFERLRESQAVATDVVRPVLGS
jgi:APA family basic amino acid/polyamine antiporter